MGEIFTLKLRCMVLLMDLLEIHGFALLAWVKFV
jgi:hypothetical protein